MQICSFYMQSHVCFILNDVLNPNTSTLNDLMATRSLKFVTTLLNFFAKFFGTS